jgi:hypothetical protein
LNSKAKSFKAAKRYEQIIRAFLNTNTMKSIHIILLFAGILLLWVITPLIVPLIAPGGKYGTFGDQFGTIASLFSGLAFAGIILALLFQRKEIELQRKDLELQREELRLQREELSKSASAQKTLAEIQKISSKLSAMSSIMSNDAEIMNFVQQHTNHWEDYLISVRGEIYDEFKNNLNLLRAL